MSWLAAVTVLITGFFGSAEFASTVFVHPIIRKLDPDNQLLFEKGLLTTVGKGMPVGMTLAVPLPIALAVDHANSVAVSAAIALVAALIVTIFGNVPNNKATGNITEPSASKKFLAMRG